MIGRFIASLALVGGMALGAGVAEAATFNVSWASGYRYGYPGPYNWDTFRTRSTLSDGQATAGAFELTATLQDNTRFNFTAFTLELENALRKRRDYVVTPTPFSNGPGQSLSARQHKDIQALFDMADPMSQDLVSTEIYSSGFQLALFEVVYETTGRAYSLDFESDNDGFFATPTDFGDAGEVGAVLYGNSLLQRLNGSVRDWTTGTYSLIFLEAPDYSSDNLVTGYKVGTAGPAFPTPVPLPASGLLMIAGAAAFMIARRR